MLEVIVLGRADKRLPWGCSKIDFINNKKTFQILTSDPSSNDLKFFELKQIDN